MQYFYAKATVDHATGSIAGASLSVDMLLESASRPKKRRTNAWHRNVYLGIMMPAALHSLLARTCLVEPLLLHQSLVNCAMWAWLGTTYLRAIAVEIIPLSPSTENAYSSKPEKQGIVSYTLG